MKIATFTLLALFSTLSTAYDMNALIESYRAIQSDLAYDRYAAVQDAATRFLPEIERALTEVTTGTPVAAHLEKFRQGTRLLSETSDPALQRRHFALLAEGACRWIKMTPEVAANWQLYRCPMVETFPYWAQPKTERMNNPYMGTEMPQCGVRKSWSSLP